MDKTIVQDEPHSVKYSINAKGMISGELKCYGSDLEATERRAQELQKKMSSYISQVNGEKIKDK